MPAHIQGSRIAQDDRPSRGHILKGVALEIGARAHAAQVVPQRLAYLAAEDDIGAAHANASARVGISLHDEQPALRAVSEALADRAVKPAPLVVEPLEDGDFAAGGALAHAVLRAALYQDIDRLVNEGGQAVARYR